MNKTYTPASPSLPSMEDCILLALKEASQRIKNTEAMWQKHPELKPALLTRSDSKAKTHIIPADNFIDKNKNIAFSLHFWNTCYDKTPVKDSLSKTGLHYHDFYEINYIYRGHINNHLQDRIIHQDSGQILLMNPFACHAPEVLSSDTILFNLLIRRECTIADNPTADKSSLASLFTNNILNSDAFHPYHLVNNTPAINQLIQQMILEYYSDSPYSQQMVYAKFIELWVEFARNINIETSLENLNYPKQVSEIINYIYAHCATVTLAETAEKFNFSTGYLSSYILKYTHRSFNELLRHFKLQTAARYLTHSDLSIEMIADSVGYNDTSYFRKIFKTEFGMSPREYRHARRTYS